MGILLSTLLVGVIYLLGTWAEAVGLGRDKMNALLGSDTPWNTLSKMYAPWTKWFVIIGSVTSMFAVMINSNNGIVRILNTMGREKLLPEALGRIDPKRRTPASRLPTRQYSRSAGRHRRSVLRRPRQPDRWQQCLRLSGLRSDACDPAGLRPGQRRGLYFRKRPDFNVLRHVVLPVLGGGLMIALLIGQIIENRTPPYSWMPWFIVGWLVLVVIVSFVLARSRPAILARAGAIMATGELEEERALHGNPN